MRRRGPSRALGVDGPQVRPSEEQHAERDRDAAGADVEGDADADPFGELARVVRPGGHVAFEVGEVRNGSVLLERLVWEAAEGLPFERLFVMVNQQEFTKTANCWGVQNNAKGTNTNRIVVLQRT